MLKRLLLSLPLLLCLLAIPSRVESQAAYNLDRQAFTISTSGNSVTYNNIKGVLNFSLEVAFTGGPSTASVTVQGCMIGGTCKTIDTYTLTANTIRSIAGLYTKIVITASWTGGSSPTTILNLYASSNTTISTSNTGGFSTYFNAYMQALPNSATTLTSVTGAYQIYCNNTTAGAVTITITDNQGSPVSFVSTFSLAANSNVTFPPSNGYMQMQGVKWSAGAAASINCMVTGFQ